MFKHISTLVFIFALVLNSFSQESEQSEDGLIAYYKLDGNFLDSSVHGRNLKPLAEGQIFSECPNINPGNKCYGAIVKAEQMKGASSDVVPCSIKNGMTISFLFKKTGTHNFTCTVVRFGGGNWKSPAIEIGMNYGSPSVKVGKKTKSKRYEGKITKDGKWHNIALVIPPKNNEFVLYIDGKEGFKGPVERLKEYGDLVILPEAARSVESIYVDEIKIYDKALPPEEIKKLLIKTNDASTK